jgi:hypothetical protein
MAHYLYPSNPASTSKRLAFNGWHMVWQSMDNMVGTRHAGTHITALLRNQLDPDPMTLILGIVRDIEPFGFTNTAIIAKALDFLMSQTCMYAIEIPEICTKDENFVVADNFLAFNNMLENTFFVTAFES